MALHCQIVTQDKSLYDGPADMVIAPGSEGEMGILPNHAPLITTLSMGVLRVRHGEEETAFTLTGGVMEARPTMVIVLADVGEEIDGIDEDRAQAAKVRAEELLAKGPPPDTDEYLAIESALRRSNLRLDAVRRYRKIKQRPRMAGRDEDR